MREERRARGRDGARGGLRVVGDEREAVEALEVRVRVEVRARVAQCARDAMPGVARHIRSRGIASVLDAASASATARIPSSDAAASRTASRVIVEIQPSEAKRGHACELRARALEHGKRRDVEIARLAAQVAHLVAHRVRERARRCARGGVAE